MLTVQGVKGGAGGILDLLKASKQVAGLDSALRYFTRSFFCFYTTYWSLLAFISVKYAGMYLLLYSILWWFFPLSSSEEAPASPSTRDAIQGMLSMANPPSSSSSSSSSSPLSTSGGGEMLGFMKEKGGRAGWISGVKKSEKKTTFQRPGKRPIKRPARHFSDEESLDEQETLGTCFKDSDYGEFTDSSMFTPGLQTYTAGEILWPKVIV